MEVMDVGDVVVKLIGPVRAVGETREDERRFESLKEMTELAERLLRLIRHAADDADRQEASMKKIGLFAKGFLQEVRHYGDKSE